MQVVIIVAINVVVSLYFYESLQSVFICACQQVLSDCLPGSS